MIYLKKSLGRIINIALFPVATIGLLQISFSAQAQDQPLTLRSLLDSAATFNPTLRVSKLDAQASTEEVTAAERQRWPTFSVTTESNTGNSSSPATRNVRIQQTLWDAGRVEGGITESENLADISQRNVDLQRQDLFIQIVTGWQALTGSRERIGVAEETISKLMTFQAQMKRRVGAEVSPSIDLELVNSRLLQTQVELVSAQSSLRIALLRLEQLSGRQDLQQQIKSIVNTPSMQSTQPFADRLADIDLNSVAAGSASVSKARMEVILSKTRLEIKKSNNWPQIYARIDQPLGRTSNSSSTSMTAFIGITYSPGAGLANLVQVQAQTTRLASQEEAVRVAVQLMRDALQTDREEFVNSRARIAALSKATEGSALVLESYQRQFQAGRKSWQDLLNAVRDLAQSQYAEADALVAMIGAMQRLEVRMGQARGLS